MSYYDVLGVAKDASMKDIKNAFKNLVNTYTNDGTTDNPDTLKKLHAVSKAYSVLGNTEKRMEYDMKLHKLKHRDNTHHDMKKHETKDLMVPSMFNGIHSYIAQQFMSMQNNMKMMMDNMEKDFSIDMKNDDLTPEDNYKYSKVFNSSVYIDNNGVKQSRVMKKINNNGKVSGKEIIKQGNEQTTTIYHPDGRVETVKNNKLIK
jgi:curved DNA-binding protein CbpA